jgi:hypothetical protein
MSRWIPTLLLLLASTVSAQTGSPDPSSGFLTDYSLLKPSMGGQVGQFIYVAPDARARFGAINAVFVEQPAFAVAPDSKVSAMSPSDATLIADTFKTLITEQLSPAYIIAVRPDPNVLTLRVALTNVHLQKPRRPLRSFTPVGMVLHAAKDAMENVMQKVDLTATVIQAELLDDNSGQVLLELYDARGNAANSKQFTDWKQVEDAMTLDAKRLKCNLDNAHLPPGAATNCWTIGATAAP